MELFLRVFLTTCLLGCVALATKINVAEMASELVDEVVQGVESVRKARAGNQDTLGSGQSLTKDQKLTSQDGRFYLIYQNDGNLAAYATAGGKAFWDAGVTDAPGKAELKGDGNLALFNVNNREYWSTHSAIIGKAPYRLVMQNDRNIVIYDSANKNIWMSRTNQ